MRLEEKIKRRKLRRRKSIRSKISGTSDRLRLSVFKSSEHIYTQLIDDDKGVTVVSASSLDKTTRAKITKDMSKINISKAVGTSIAAKAKEMNIKRVVFDRSGYVYHGRIKALADAAREAGLEF
jgi:large subunit ribosomal protein L18